jgi:hypothetical protein
MKLTNYLKTKLGKSLHLLTGISASMMLLSSAQVSAQSTSGFIKSDSHIGGYNIKCNGQSTGMLEAIPNFGTAPYTFLWNTGETTALITDKPAGIYYVEAIDANNLLQRDTFELKQPSAFTLESRMSDYNGYQVSPNGNNNGSVEIIANGGTPPYEYAWSNGDNSSIRTDLTAGTYSFVVSDANQCNTNGSITITEPSPIQVSFTNVQATSCFEGSDGRASININGGLGDFSVMWKNGSFSLSPDDLSAGYNSVRIFEQGKAILDTGILITEPNAIESQFALSQYNGFNVSCADCFNGSINPIVTGGTAPYSYQWLDATNSTTANLSNLNGGEYRLLITDAHGCISKNGTYLSMPSPKDWSRNGNANIDTTEFIGSTDTSSVIFKSNNHESLRLAGNGNIGVGVHQPTEKLDINGNLKLSGALKIGNEGAIRSRMGNAYMNGIVFENTAPLIANLEPGMPTCIPNWSTENYNFFNGYLAIRNQNYASRPALYIGSDGETGVIESTREISGNPLMHLKLNNYCGNDVLVGNSTSGNLIANYHFGIGTDAPNEKFHLMNGNMLVENSTDSQNPIFFVDHLNKNVGIGTAVPRAKFEVKASEADVVTFGAMRTEQSGWATSYMALNAYRNDAGTWATTSDGSNAGGSVIFCNTIGDLMFTTFNGTGTSEFYTSDMGIKSGTKMTISNDGRVGIGVNPSAHYDLLNYKLVVDGNVKCKKLRVDLQNWGDYVFDSNYELMDLAGIENYIAENKHLPGMPSASEVEKDGVDLGEIVKMQQVKIEELTLLMIQMQKQIEFSAKNK